MLVSRISTSALTKFCANNDVTILEYGELSLGMKDEMGNVADKRVSKDRRLERSGFRQT